MHSVVAIGLALTLAGCGGLAPSKAPIQQPPLVVDQPLKSPTPIPGEVAGMYSWNSQTGVAVVDQIIGYLANRDSANLVTRLKGIERPCPVAGIDGPISCSPGSATGSPIPVFPYFWCGPSYTQLPQAAGVLQRYVDAKPNLYAAYQLKDGGPAGIGAAYGILMASGLDDPSAFLLYVDQQGKISAMLTGCGRPGATAPRVDEVVYLLPPQAGQEAKADQSAYILQLLRDEGAQMLHTLQFATGEIECAGLDCSKPIPLQIAQALQQRCDKIGPESLRQSGGYDPAVHRELMEAYESTCKRMGELAQATPPPADETILAAFNEAKARLRGALKEPK
jgi:hypothetical protein